MQKQRSDINEIVVYGLFPSLFSKFSEVRKIASNPVPPVANLPIVKTMVTLNTSPILASPKFLEVLSNLDR